MVASISRRRTIGIAAAAAGLSLLPLRRAAKAAAGLVAWRGEVLGAVATLQIHHHDRAAAERLVERSLAEVRRLETVFSLYRNDSALTELNRQGVLVAPPRDLVALLSDCRRYADLTDGAFDPTVQPLWTLYREHFARRDADPDGPAQAALQAALAKVGLEHVLVDGNRIAFLRRGMALTLNGIAQGYVTDRVVDILRAGGIERSLVDMGEHRALGEHPDGRPWQIGIENPDDPNLLAETLAVTDQAVATSGGYGFRFDAAGRFNHLMDPHTGASASRYKSVTVVLPTATAADALSTAFSLMPADRIETALHAVGGGRVVLLTGEGRRLLAA